MEELPLVSDEFNHKLTNSFFSKITWKKDGEHAVTGFLKYQETREFVKLVGLDTGTLTATGKQFNNVNRVNEIEANLNVAELIRNLEENNDFRRKCFVSADIAIVRDEVQGFPEWTRKWIDEYAKHASGTKSFAFLIMKDLSGCVPLWEWWTERQALSKVSEDLVLLVAQIVWALKALADAGIVHNDLHWNNIMVEEVSPPEPISFGGEGPERTFVQKYRPVIFDWDRAVSSVIKGEVNKKIRHHITTFDPHYDLLGFYKNLTQKYKTLRMWWRFMLHQYFENTFEAFPSFAVDHPHHANPCLNVADFDPLPSYGRSATEQVNMYLFSKDYRFNRTEPRVKGDTKQVEDFRKNCVLDWNEVDAWTKFESKPSHEEIVSRLLHFLNPIGTDLFFIDSESITRHIRDDGCAEDQPSYAMDDETAALIEMELEMLEYAEEEAKVAEKVAEARAAEVRREKEAAEADRREKEAEKDAADALNLLSKIERCEKILNGLLRVKRATTEAVSTIARAKITTLARLFARTLYVPLLVTNC
jgi:hypothetical protein